MIDHAGLPAAVDAEGGAAAFAADVRAFLNRDPRQLPSRYFYDPLGSALFDAICHLPWYGITRAERRLIAAQGAALHRRGPFSAIVELGPGNGEKLRLLIESRGPVAAPLEVHLVDVSSRALEIAARAVERLGQVRVIGHTAEYAAGLREAAARIGAPGRTLVLFLGSNIGNFEPSDAAALLRRVRGSLSAGDALLLGTDLVKPEHDLRLAYDDPLGLTAAFNRNLLLRINNELDGNFQIDRFAHQAVWNADESRIEMHLVARSAQHVRIGGVPMEFSMRPGERIWTESSYKYRPGEVAAMVGDAGFRAVEQWIDEDDRFMLTLAAVE